MYLPPTSCPHLCLVGGQRAARMRARWLKAHRVPHAQAGLRGTPWCPSPGRVARGEAEQFLPFDVAAGIFRWCCTDDHRDAVGLSVPRPAPDRRWQMVRWCRRGPPVLSRGYRIAARVAAAPRTRREFPFARRRGRRKRRAQAARRQPAQPWCCVGTQRRLVAMIHPLFRVSVMKKFRFRRPRCCRRCADTAPGQA